MKDNGRFRKRQHSFTMVSNAVLRDPSLSLTAKGLYAEIASYIDIPDFVLYKSYLVEVVKEGLRAFNTAWNELKAAGYLKMYKIRSVAEDGKAAWKYEYELLEVADKETPCLTVVGLDGEVKAKEIKEEKTAEEKKNKEIVTEEVAEREIREQISYDILKSEEVGDMPTIVDNIVSIMEDVYIAPEEEKIWVNKKYVNAGLVKKRLRRLDEEHIRQAIDNFRETSKTKKITKVQQYLLSILYNIAVTFEAQIEAEVRYKKE